MRAGVAVLGVLVVAPVLQGTLLYRAAPGGVTIDLVFLVSVTVGLVAGALAGLACGVTGGLLVGTALGGAALPMAALYGMLGAGAALAGRRHPLLAAVPVAAAFTALLIALEAILLAPLGGTRPALGPAMALMAWHAALALPLAMLLSRPTSLPPRP